MSEFEREILDRIPVLKQRQDEAAQQRALELERNRERDVQKQLKEQQARSMGMEVVRLLQKYEVPSKPVWALEVTGKHTRQSWSKSGILTLTEDRKDYIKQGQGWRICRRGGGGEVIGGSDGSTVIGIEDSGRVFEIASHQVPVDRYDLANKRVHPGLGVQKYLEASSAESILKSDFFKDAVAAIIDRNGLQEM